MSSPLIASNREKAEISTGDAAGKQKIKEVLKKFSLPNNLLPVKDVVEVGYNHSTGFLWIIQKKKVEHTFPALNRKVNFDTEVTAFIEDRRMKKLTGAKSRELMIWFTICDIHINDPKSGKIVFGSTVGVTRTFPVTAFEEEKVEKEGKSENLRTN